MKNSEVLEKINEFILNEKGSKVVLEDKLLDSGLDSFGHLMFLLELEEEFPIFDGVAPDDQIDYIDRGTSILELIHICRAADASKTESQ